MAEPQFPRDVVFDLTSGTHAAPEGRAAILAMEAIFDAVMALRQDLATALGALSEDIRDLKGEVTALQQ